MIEHKCSTTRNEAVTSPEFYQVAFRKRVYEDIDSLQADLDQWLHHYNTQRTHQGKMCCGRTP